jgi:MOSC domain-containing protein YiiM
VRLRLNLRQRLGIGKSSAGFLARVIYEGGINMKEITIKINPATERKLQKYIDRNNSELPEGERHWAVEDAVNVLMLMRLDDEIKSMERK